MHKSKSLQVTAELQRTSDILAAKRFITDVEIEHAYGIPRKTLQNWRVLGKGPRFRKFGSGVRYKVSDVEAWVESLPSGGLVYPRVRFGAPDVCASDIGDDQATCRPRFSAEPLTYSRGRA